LSEDVPAYGEQQRRRGQSRRYRSSKVKNAARADRFQFFLGRATLIVALIVPLATIYMLYRTVALQDRAAKATVNQQYVALAIALLKEEPKTSMEKALRNWEVDVFKDSAPIQISLAVEQSLREGAAIPIRGDAVSGTSATGTLR
jgi:hypothetical protein